MKKVLCFIVLLFLACPGFSEESHCKNPEYLDLMGKDINSMTDTEYKRFKKLNDLCLKVGEKKKDEFAIVTDSIVTESSCQKPGLFMKENWGIRFKYKGKVYYRNNTNLKKVINNSNAEEAKKELKKARRSVVSMWTLPWLIVTLPVVPVIAKGIWNHRNSAIDEYNNYVFDELSENGCSDEYIEYAQ